MKKIYFITYHYVRPIKKSKYPNLKSLELSKFVEQLNYLQKKFKIINYEEILNLFKKKKKISSKKDLCVLTFDDGYKDCIKYIYPELKKRNLTGLFFPSVQSSQNYEILDVNKIQFILAKQKSYQKIFKTITENLNQSEIREIINQRKKFVNKHPYDNKKISFLKFLFNNLLGDKKKQILNVIFKKFVTKDYKKFSKELYMSTNDLVKLHKNSMFIGCHGANHVHLNKIKPNEIANEISLNLKFLKKNNIYRKDWIMCYPYGSYNKSTLDILRKKKCFLALTINNGPNYIHNIKKYEIRRIDCNEVNKMFKS